MDVTDVELGSWRNCHHLKLHLVHPGSGFNQKVFLTVTTWAMPMTEGCRWKETMGCAQIITSWIVTGMFQFGNGAFHMCTWGWCDLYHLWALPQWFWCESASVKGSKPFTVCMCTCAPEAAVIYTIREPYPNGFSVNLPVSKGVNHSQYLKMQPAHEYSPDCSG